MSDRSARQTPLGLLSQRRAALGADLRLLAGAKACAVILALASVALGAATVATHQWGATFVVRVLAWLGTAAAVWAWQAWRRIGLAREAASLDRLAEELKQNA
jgi:hypothetical protein